MILSLWWSDLHQRIV